MDSFRNALQNYIASTSGVRTVIDIVERNCWGWVRESPIRTDLRCHQRVHILDEWNAAQNLTCNCISGTWRNRQTTKNTEPELSVNQWQSQPLLAAQAHNITLGSCARLSNVKMRITACAALHSGFAMTNNGNVQGGSQAWLPHR